MSTYYCPECRNKLEELASCGTIGYFCNSCNKLISSKKIISENEIEKVYRYTITDEETFENVYKDEEILINHVVIPPGKIFPKHPTDADVFAIIIRGELDVAIEENLFKTYRTGQMVSIPKGARSELGNRSEELVELFVVKLHL
jgi:quercetin dioxygenase-like cupin family protein